MVKHILDVDEKTWAQVHIYKHRNSLHKINDAAVELIKRGLKK